MGCGATAPGVQARVRAEPWFQGDEHKKPRAKPNPSPMGPITWSWGACETLMPSPDWLGGMSKVLYQSAPGGSGERAKWAGQCIAAALAAAMTHAWKGH